MPPATAGDIDEDDVVIEAFQEVAATSPRIAADLSPAQAGTLRHRRRKTRSAPACRSPAAPRSRRSPLPGVLLLDTIGELAGLFERAGVGLHGRNASRSAAATIFWSRPISENPSSSARTWKTSPPSPRNFTTPGALALIQKPAELAPAVDTTSCGRFRPRPARPRTRAGQARRNHAHRSQNLGCVLRRRPQPASETPGAAGPHAALLDLASRATAPTSR